MYCFRLLPTAPCIARVLETSFEYGNYRLPTGVNTIRAVYRKRSLILIIFIFSKDGRFASHVVGVPGRKQFQRRFVVQAGKVVGRANKEIAIPGGTVRMWQANVSGKTVRRTGTTSRLG